MTRFLINKIYTFFFGVSTLGLLSANSQGNAVSEAKVKIANTIVDTIEHQLNVQVKKTKVLYVIDFEDDSLFFTSGTVGTNLILQGSVFDSIYFNEIKRINKNKIILSKQPNFHTINVFYTESNLNPPFEKDTSNKVIVEISKPIFGWDNLYIFTKCHKRSDGYCALFPHYRYKKIEVPVSVFYTDQKQVWQQVMLFEFEIVNTSPLEIKFIRIAELSK